MGSVQNILTTMLSALAVVLLVQCGERQAENHSNALNGLANESSVYLLRHANNPVNWVPWSDAAFEEAQELDRLVIISSGYMACHWCHVMERESFSNDSIAEFMNAHFVCIKVDREERPDVDQVYLDAVEMISGRAGWPLNCITLPDGRPVYGGTYFTPEDWMKVLTRIHELYRSDKSKIESIADELTAGLNALWTMDGGAASLLPLDSLVLEHANYFDPIHGGDKGAPKFILPGDLAFLLHFGVVRNDENALAHLANTLERLPSTGIYDALGGGFFRYTVDAGWEVPHFEKMLYDNAQAIALYSDAYRWSGNRNYLEVARETVDFVSRELMAPDGSFYSSLDADSDGEEGGYYRFTAAELDALAMEHPILDSILSATPIEAGTESLAIRIQAHGNGDEKTKATTEAAKRALLRIRQRREPPQVDTKILTSWNALMVQALCSAWRASGDARYLEAARRATDAVTAGALKADGMLFHTRTGSIASVEGLLDDYGYLLEALCDLYACTWDERYLHQALAITDAIKRRFVFSSGVYAYRQGDRGRLPGIPPNVHDNVVPSANAAVANGFFMLGTLTANPDLIRAAADMLRACGNEVIRSGGYHHWGGLQLRLEHPFHAVVLTGVDYRSELRHSIDAIYLPQAILVGGAARQNPLLEGKPDTDTLIYVCKEGACRLPVKTIEDALVEMDYR